MCDCGQDYATHEKILARKDQFTITIKKCGRQEEFELNRIAASNRLSRAALHSLSSAKATKLRLAKQDVSIDIKCSRHQCKGCS